MSDMLARNIAISLPQQLYAMLLERVQDGTYQRGTRLDSIRSLSQEFGVSTRVVIQAIELLEKDGAVVRLPARGVFVSEKATGERPVDMVFVFPEIAISPDILAPEMWAIDLELYRGLMAGAVECGARVQLEHFPEESDSLRLTEQCARLKRYDAVVFPGRQNEALRRLIRPFRPVVLLDKLGESPTDSAYSPDLEWAVDASDEETVARMLRHVTAGGYRRAGVLSVTEEGGASLLDRFFLWRGETFRRLAADAGLEVTARRVDKAACGGDLRSGFEAALREGVCEFLFFNHTESYPLFYQAVAKTGLRQGRDFDVMTICSGLTIRGLFPASTYVRVPYFEIGRRAAVTAARAVREAGSFSPCFQPVPSVLEQGETTRRVSDDGKDKAAAAVAAAALGAWG